MIPRRALMALATVFAASALAACTPGTDDSSINKSIAKALESVDGVASATSFYKTNAGMGSNLGVVVRTKPGVADLGSVMKGCLGALIKPTAQLSGSLPLDFGLYEDGKDTGVGLELIGMDPKPYLDEVRAKFK